MNVEHTDMKLNFVWELLKTTAASTRSTNLNSNCYSQNLNLKSEYSSLCSGSQKPQSFIKITGLAGFQSGIWCTRIPNFRGTIRAKDTAMIPSPSRPPSKLLSLFSGFALLQSVTADGQWLLTVPSQSEVMLWTECRHCNHHRCRHWQHHFLDGTRGVLPHDLQVWRSTTGARYNNRINTGPFQPTRRESRDKD